MIISLSSGTNNSYDLSVFEGDRALQLTVKLPGPMVDVRRLHAFWLSGDGLCISEDHPKIGAFVQALKEWTSSSDTTISSISTIPLPIQVETGLLFEGLLYKPSTFIL